MLLGARGVMGLKEAAAITARSRLFSVMGHEVRLNDALYGVVSPDLPRLHEFQRVKWRRELVAAPDTYQVECLAQEPEEPGRFMAAVAEVPPPQVREPERLRIRMRWWIDYTLDTLPRERVRFGLGVNFKHGILAWFEIPLGEAEDAG